MVGSALSGTSLVWFGVTFAIVSLFLWLLFVSVLVRNLSLKQGVDMSFWQVIGICIVEPLFWYGGVFLVAVALLVTVELFTNIGSLS